MPANAGDIEGIAEDFLETLRHLTDTERAGVAISVAQLAIDGAKVEFRAPMAFSILYTLLANNLGVRLKSG